MSLILIRTEVMDIHAGRRRRGSWEAPDMYRTQEVAYAINAFVVNRRMTVAEGV